VQAQTDPQRNHLVVVAMHDQGLVANCRDILFGLSEARNTVLPRIGEYTAVALPDTVLRA
jgi:hypothetical protein